MSSPQIVLISGCSSGIGLPTAVFLAKDAQKRFKVYATMRNLAKKGQLEEEGKEYLGDTLLIKQMDVCIDESVEKAVKEVLDTEGRVDVLFNNAGTLIMSALECVPIKVTNELFEVNVFGALRLIQAVLPSMKARRSGLIINNSSHHGVVGVPFVEIYSSSKFALEGLTESMAPLLGQFNIRCCLLQPGPVETPVRSKASDWSQESLDLTTMDAKTKSLMEAVNEYFGKILGETIQSSEEIAQIVQEIILGEKKNLRHQTNVKYGPGEIAAKLADPTGDALINLVAKQWQSESLRDDIDDNFDIVFPERIDKGRSKRDLSTGLENGHDEEATFKLRAFGKDVVVEVHINKMVSSPQFTLRYFKEDGQVVQRKEAPPNCQYQGHLRGHEAQSTVILDTCHGLSGLIEDEDGRMYIEPYPAKGEGAHKIFKTRDGKWKMFSCGASLDGITTAEELSHSQIKSRVRRVAEESVYKKYLTTTKTRYTELMIIVDNAVYKKYKQDIDDVKRRVFTLVNAVDTIYRKINIRVVLSALEIWTDEDHVPFVKRAGDDLRNFLSHHSSRLAGVTYDSIHLLRGVMWDDYGGMAYRGEICTRRSLGVDAWNYWGSLGPWLALSHELGHNFNFDHDNIWSCKCLSPRGCVMGSFKTRVPGFSDCNLLNMTKMDDSCLYNLPQKIVNSTCGNGIPEPGEQCDCGTPESFCYHGKCTASADSQCQSLWGAGASSAPRACYEKLNVEAQGFGTCSGQTNLPCARRHATCGQLQCSSPRDRPVVDYGSYYELKILPTGEKCRAAIRKGGNGKELEGMVKDGTVCGNNEPQHTEEETVANRGQKSLLVTRTVVQVVYSCYTTKRYFNLMVHSCHHLLSLGKQTGVQFPDGVYTINPDGKGAVNTYCDMTRDDGGWTLLVTSHTNTWTADNIRQRNPNRPTLNGDFSILNKADDIKNSLNVAGEWFEYRIEGQERGRWGGIWRAPREYTFVATDNKQTFVELVKKFDNWKYDDYGVEKRMPWISGPKLTTSWNATGDRQWGTLIANSKLFFPAPWLDGKDLEQHPVNIWYWVRERSYSPPRSCAEIQLRGLYSKPLTDGLYTIKPGDRQVQTFCKFSDHGGAWTLVLTSASDNGWTRDSVKSRNTHSPSLSSDFSLLEMADKITKMKHFQYRMEEDGANTWEGVWTGNAGCSFTSSRSDGGCAKLLHQQGHWDAGQVKSTKHLPHLTTSGYALLTSADDQTDINSAIVLDSTHGVSRARTGIKRLWLREGTWRSCNEIKSENRGNKAAGKDGLYFIRKNSHEYLPVYCDMTSEQGAYTLLVTSASNGWKKNEVKLKNPTRPLLSRDYSILGYADQIKALGGAKRFKYRLEANERGHWGGVWTAPMKYKTIHTTLTHKASGFCVHPLSGTPVSGTTAIMWNDDCSENRLRLDFLKLQVFDSPIQASGGFCLLPESASCTPADNSPLVYHQSSRCDQNYMYFTYKGEVLVHTCSGKRVCPEGPG
ncbi:Retinol dehydrogenase 8 [Stylophora pistillata]|uniref:Retinol dehydrogenase 8 n=1 Tax=Stylophora pistillata TaxID=50429 RepID=A0A2B4SP49_STYPI|nr:Retinol dehydrogenase 8 [Stylophora pistillata]